MVVTTVNNIGERIVEVLHQNPRRQVLFVVTACDLSLHLFCDLRALVGACGIGIRLQGKTCPTRDAFALAESGMKPTLTWLSDDNEENLLTVLRAWRTRVEK